MDRPPLWTRLKEAKAVQVVLVYLGVCWFVVQLVSSLQEMLELPRWIGPVTLVLLAVGLVVVLATAWVQSLPSTTAAEEAGEIPTDWEIAPGDVMKSLKAGRLPHLTWGRAILGGVVALSLAIGVSGGYVLLRTEGRMGPTPVEASDTHDGVAVLPFTAAGPGLDEFAEGMVSLVSMNIDGVDGIRSVSPRTVLAEWTTRIDDGSASLEEALDVAGATGARYAVVGDAVSTGASVRFTAELYDLADGTSVGRGRAEGSLDDVLGLIDEMSIDLLRTLVAESGRQSVTGIQQLDGLVTSSVEALNAYFQGEGHFREGRTTEALEAYERAVAADSTFALGWSRIASVYGWLQVDAEALTEARARALELIDRLPAREATLTRAYSAVSGTEPDPQLLAELRRHVERFPDDPEGWAVLGEYYLHVPGVLHTEAQTEEALLRAVDLDPDFAPYYVHALRYLVGQGDWRFYEYMETYRGVVDEEPAERYQMQWDFFHGRDSTRARAEAFYRENPTSAVNTTFEVLLRSDSIAERNLDMIRLALDDSPLRAPFETLTLAGLGRFDELPTGDDPNDVLWGASAVALTSVLSDADVGGLSPRAAASQLAAVVSEIADENASDGSETSPAARDLRVLADALTSLADGDLEDAERTLSDMESRGAATFLLGWWQPVYAESLARTGEARQAIAHYESALHPWRAIVRLRLGELYEQLGEREAAAESYRGFLRLFRDADAAASGLVQRGLDGLARVGG